jgi:phosphoglycerate dehydrogenase-like enzyme
MRRVVVDQDITPTESVRRGLPDDWEVSFGIEGTTEGAVAALAEADVALVTSRVPLDRHVFERASRLEVIGKLGTGVDNIDRAAAADHGIPVTHTPGYNALSVAEHTLCLVLATARRLTEARTILERGGWRDEFTLATRLSGKTVGIVGFGDIGRRFGSLLAGFDVDVLVADPYVPEVDAELVGGAMTSLSDLLATSDVVVLTTELTPETRGLLGEAELDRMRSSAVLVNTARGPVVDEDALVAALESGRIAGAGLDVFAEEPLGADSRLLDLDTVVTTPHTAAMTRESRVESIDRLTSNVVSLTEGRAVDEQFMARATE